MADLLAKDLDMSGFFIVAPKSVMDRELTEEGIDKKEIRFENWRSLGIELVCKGLLQTQDGGLGTGDLPCTTRAMAPCSSPRDTARRPMSGDGWSTDWPTTSSRPSPVNGAS